MTDTLALIGLIFGCGIGVVLLRIGNRLRRNRHMSFSEHDYQTGIAFDRRNNRIIITRRLKMSALMRLLS